MRAGVTAKPHEAVGQDAALQVGVKFLHDVRRQAFGGGIGREGGQKGFEMVRDDLVEHRGTGVSRLVDRWYHMQTFRQQPLLQSLQQLILYICALY